MEKIRKRNKSRPKKGKTEIGLGKKIRKRERECTIFIISNHILRLDLAQTYIHWGDIFPSGSS
jgi:hypothetical protein